MISAAPTQLQLDALKELCNIGCGHAAHALSRLVGGRRVDINVPTAMLASAEELPRLLGGAHEPVVCAQLDIVGPLNGSLLVVLSSEDAKLLTELLLGAAPEGTLAGAHRDAFSEMANILASACLSAIGNLTGLKLLPSVPRLSEDSAASVVAGAVNKGPRELGVVLEAQFTTVTSPSLSGHLVLVPDPNSLKALLQKLGV